jgi:hypothetical protein
MSDLIKINNKGISVKECGNQRVVTFKEIDELHERPEGTAYRNFNSNKVHFINGKDYFLRNSSEAKSEFGITAPNGLVLVAESGYLMLVKSLTDDLSWTIQRQLVDTYFRAKKDPAFELMMRDPIMAIRYNQIQMGERLKLNESKTQLIETRLDNLDTVNIQGTEQQRLNAMIRKYSFKEGILYNTAWNQFKQAFNTAYHTNLETLINKYKEKHNLKSLTAPQYLHLAGKLEDALRVADKMLNAA